MSFGINVYKHTITFDSDMHTPVAGSTGIEMQFTFSKDYEGMAKCICFCVKDKLGENIADVLPTVLLAPEQNTAVLPWEVLKPEYVGFELLIGISAFSAGSKVIYPTTYFKVGEILEGAKCTDVEPLEPTTPIVVELYKVAQEAKDIATEANAKVDAVRAEWDKALQDNIFKGEKGDSAYKVAQLNGFTGTEEEWLASLRYDHSDEFTVLAEQVKADTAQSAENVLKSAENANQSAESASKAKVSETNAKTSETQSSQNLSDLLHTIGTSIPTLVDGKIPMSQIPATATTEIYRVNSADELVTLTAQKGDLAELVEDVQGEQTITKTWQLLGEDSTVRSNWIVWGTSYAVQAGSATIAETANNAERINGMRLVTMNYSDFETAVKDADTLYAVDMEV